MSPTPRAERSLQCGTFGNLTPSTPPCDGPIVVGRSRHPRTSSASSATSAEGPPGSIRTPPARPRSASYAPVGLAQPHGQHFTAMLPHVAPNFRGRRLAPRPANSTITSPTIRMSVRVSRTLLLPPRCETCLERPCLVIGTILLLGLGSTSVNATLPSRR